MLKVAVATHYPTPVPRLHKYAAILESRGFKFVWDVPPTLANPYVYALTHALRLPPECDIALGFGHDGMLAVSKFPGPIIYDYPDPFYGEDRPTNPLSSGLAKIFSRLEARLVRRASFVCTSSRMQSEYLIAKHDLPPSRVPFFWNSVDPHQFHRINKSDLGIEGLDGWTGVYLGQLAQSYGLSMALESWPGDHLLIVSKYRDPNRARILIEKGKRRGLDVRVVGPVTHESVPGYLSLADVAILPFMPTPLNKIAAPNKLFEYMACGLPVIASGLPQISAIVEEGATGFLFEPGDHESFSAACRRAFEADLNTIGRKATELVATKYNLRREADRYAETLGLAERQPKWT